MDVAAAAEDCINQLTAIANSGEATQRQKSRADDQCARLKLWADSLGVFAQEQQYTFQHRLRLNPPLLEVTLQLLRGLLANIRLLERSLVQPKSDADTALPDDGDSSDSSTSADENIQARIDARLQDVRDRISRLVRLSVLLRREGAQKREAKALNFDPLDSSGASLVSDFKSYVDKVLIRMFNHTQDDASTPSISLPNFMRERLERVIEARWRRLSYGNHHAKGLAGQSSGLATDIELPKLRSKMSSKLDAKSPQNSQPANIIAARIVAVDRSSKPASAASTAPRDLTYDGKAAGRALSTGTATTKIRPNKVDLPRPPTLKGDAEEFECPYCHMICSSKEQEKSLWQVHVMHDLAPYVCLFEDCTLPTLMFRTADAWVGHMIEAHSQTIWNCTDCKKQTLTENGEKFSYVFESIQDYKAHISEIHPSPISDEHLALLLQMDGRQQLRIADCIFCGFPKTSDHLGKVASDQIDLEEITRHIAEEHLHSLALLSLPWDTPTGDDLHSAKASVSSIHDAQNLPQDEAKETVAPQPRANAEGALCAASFDEIRRTFAAEPKAAKENCHHEYCMERGGHCRVPQVEPWRNHPAMSLAAYTDQLTAEARWLSVATEESSESIFPVDSWSASEQAQYLEFSLDQTFDMEILEHGNRDKSWVDEQSSLLHAATTGDSHTLYKRINAGVDLTCTDSEGLNALQLAVKHNQVECLEIILHSSANPDFQPDEQPLLCFASAMRSQRIVEYLITSGADIDGISSNFGSAMHVACSLGHVAIVDSLLRYGAKCDVTRLFDLTSFRALSTYSDEPWLDFCPSPWMTKRFKATPLALAAYFAKADVVDLLLNHGVKVDALSTCWLENSQSLTSHSWIATALTFATFGNNPKVIAALLDAGADKEYVDNDGDTPFLTGVAFGTLDALKVLVARNAPVTARDASGFNALTRCVAHDKKAACLAWLIELGLDVNDQSPLYGTTPLIAATAQSRDTHVVQMLLDAGALPDSQDSAGYHALYYAAASNGKATLELLLACGASLSLTTKQGETALMMAACRGLLSNVELLLTKGTRINAATSDGKTALSIAATLGYREVVRHLCAKGAIVDTKDIDGQTPLAAAARNGHSGTMRILLEQPSVNIDLQDGNGETALFKAARRNHVECLQILINAGASTHLADQEGNTALDAATEKGHVNCVGLLVKVDTSTDRAVLIATRKGNAACLKKLLDAKASPNIQNGEGMSALMLASSQGHRECLSLLLDFGASVEQLDTHGNSAIYYACDKKSIDCLRLLLDRKGDPNEQGNRGKTPLMTAAMSWAPEAVLCARLLLKRGAEVDKTDHAGNTALSKAIFGSVEMLKCLIEAEAQIDHPDAMGLTALMQAAGCGFLEEAKTLLDSGADINFANPVSGMTALACAISEGEFEMAGFLASAGASIAKTVDSLEVSSLRTVRMRVRIEFKKKYSRSGTNAASDNIVSVSSLDSTNVQQQDNRKPLDMEFLQELMATLTARIERLKADRHPFVALSPFFKAILRKKATSIRRSRTRLPRPSMSARQVSFLPPSGAQSTIQSASRTVTPSTIS